jgi:YhcN/YlaJ family sporulation lipoprotein
MSYIKPIITVAFGLFLLSGCAANNEGQQGNNNVGQTDVGYRHVGYNTINNRTDQDVRIQVANEAANRVIKLEEVRQANVIVTNQNAYVSVMLNDNPKGDLTKDIEAKIAREVKATDDHIDNVFVSTNPDFLDRMNDYGYRIQQGEPVQGLFDEFSELVRRVFPNPR